ncbi:hypothetical protein HPP92_016514 [Vanilla planifolia]|uniref:Helicase Sen1 N-terminal domain-containing protein n=1 Tax=Vanilla planifolia TaxID=51239 RepID=A0A835QK60_VANPL|nr:hypothetical protein HPP92_017102 [Vanilla planifolia]KAG0471968.1 hypothetical protein HPP92_016514 [Vanilla planifolia]
MAKRACGRRELLDRWKGIREQVEDEDDPSPSKQRQICRVKEEWFSDCFGFLENISDEVHLWCGYPDLMGPLLETFHNYYCDQSSNSPLKLMWKRISEELGQCMQCIFQHHQAQESYDLEYESDAVGPLLKVLHQLDEERVAGHIKEINSRIKHGEYDADSYSSAVISIMFEVLTYPVLFDDLSLVNEFQIFLEAVDKHHDVTLAGSQQYPGVYALLFLKSGRARAIGYRLAGCMGKLRNAADLEPLQPLLKKYIGFLETDAVPSTISDSRPRVVLERTTVWLGVKTLLGFLEAPAYEEGVLERYPVFLSIVLNHVSGDTLDFSYAIACLRISFEILGSKLWLRTALSPSVMRNTLLASLLASEMNISVHRGPSLINSLKDSTLHSSLRQPAFDLIATIIVSDASALIFLKQKTCLVNKNDFCFFVSSIDEDDEANIPEGAEEKDNCCWTEFSLQCKLVLSECAAWMCVPLLWHGVLLEVGPATLPASFSKAVFWVLSHVSVVELNFNSDLSLPVHDWLSVNATEISSSFQWQTPTGSDDGGEGRNQEVQLGHHQSLFL